MRLAAWARSQAGHGLPPGHAIRNLCDQQQVMYSLQTSVPSPGKWG